MEPNEILTAVFLIYLFLLVRKDRLCVIPALFVLPLGIAILADPASDADSWYAVCIMFSTFSLLARSYATTKWAR